MKQYSIKSFNLTNSLVFYRALFNGMPQRMNATELSFQSEQVSLQVSESLLHDKQAQPFVFPIHAHVELHEVSRRMARFHLVGRATQNCTEIREAIGLIDPDGYKWIIGDPTAKVEFEKCYVNEFY